MRIHKMAALALAPFILLACEPQTDGDPMVEDDGVAEERTHQVGDTETLGLSEIDNSGVTGDVRFTVLTMNETDVIIEVDDAQPNASYQAAIHQGSCDMVGQQRHPLESIQTNAEGNGATSTTLNVRLADVMDGNHVVALYGPRVETDRDADPDLTDDDRTDDIDEDVQATGERPVACGEISEYGGLGW